ncbi:coiled-coil domain-containing protein 170-like [Procambarus clarkii]|uniref:coiled-coil domain-containing protein 170-like n=1 Tax=Procambarus clarkii TaxID=6728 RepID=UPI003743F998
MIPNDLVVTEHRSQQSEVESRGFLTTVAALLSSPEHRLLPETQVITDRIQSLVSTNREAAEHVERLTSQVTSLGEQSRRQSELYETAVKRGRQSEADLHALSNRCRQLEADHAAAESSREHLAIEREKAGRVLARVVEALGLAEMGREVTNDAEMIICRCQQLAKLEGEKIVDKTTTVYQLQRKVKALRETVERKDLHVDMLRRKLALTEDAARASRHLEEERDDLIAKYKRQCRMVERLNAEVAEARLHLRDLKAQLTDAADEKSRAAQQQKKIEELTAKVNELDAIRSRQQKKISHLKEQVKAHGEQMLEGAAHERVQLGRDHAGLGSHKAGRQGPQQEGEAADGVPTYGGGAGGRGRGAGSGRRLRGYLPSWSG